jgi:hypothetical protein
LDIGDNIKMSNTQLPISLLSFPEVTTLLRTLDSKSLDDRVAAALAFSEVGWADVKVIQPLVDYIRLSTYNVDIKQRATDALVNLATTHEIALQAIIKAFKTARNDDPRYDIAEALTNVVIHDKRIADMLIQTVKHPSTWWICRTACIKALHRMGFEPDDDIIQICVTGLHNSHEERDYLDVEYAWESIVELGIEDKRIYSILLSNIKKSKEGSIGSVSTRLIGRLGVRDRKTINLLLKELRGGNWFDDVLRFIGIAPRYFWHTKSAAESLGHLGITDTRIINSLVKAMRLARKRENEDIKIQCAISLAKLGVKNKDVLDVLLMGLGHTLLGRHCADILVKLEVRDNWVIDILIDGLDVSRSNLSLFINSTRVLGKLGVDSDRIVKILIKGLQYRREYFQASIEALNDLGVPRDTIEHALVNCLKHGTDDTHANAAVTLTRIGREDNTIVDTLCERLMHEDNIDWTDCIDVLGTVGIESQKIGEVLLQLLHDPDHVVKVHAGMSLGARMRRVTLEKSGEIASG